MNFELYNNTYSNLDKNVELYKMMENYEPLELKEIYNLLIFINKNNLNYDLISNYITSDNINYFFNLLDENEDIRNNIIKLLPYEISEIYTTISKNIPQIYKRLRNNESIKLTPIEIYYLLLYVYNNNLDYKLVSEQINNDNIKYLYKLLDDNEIIRNNLSLVSELSIFKDYPNFDEESWLEHNFENIKYDELNKLVNYNALNKYILKQYEDTYYLLNGNLYHKNNDISYKDIINAFNDNEMLIFNFIHNNMNDVNISIIFLIAVSENNIEFVKYLINNGINLEYLNTAVSIAIKNGNLDMLELLVNNGANLNVDDNMIIFGKNVKFNQYISYAIINNKDDILKYLLCKNLINNDTIYPQLINSINKNPNVFNLLLQYSNDEYINPLKDEINLKSIDVSLKYLHDEVENAFKNWLENYNDKQINVDKNKILLDNIHKIFDNNYENTEEYSLNNYIINNDIENLKLLVRNGFDLNKINNINEYILLALESNSDDILDYFIELNLINPENIKNVLYYSIEKNNINIIEKLYRDIDDDLLYNLFSYAIIRRNYEVIDYFINKGIDLRHNNLYILKYISEKGDLEIFKYLVRLDPTIIDEYSFMTLAVKGKKYDIFKYLLKANIPYDNFLNNLNFAIIEISKNGDIELLKYIIKFFKQNYMNITEALNYSIYSPLIAAIIGGHFEIVKILIENGNRISKDILNIAMNNRRYDIAKYLIDKDFDLNNRDTISKELEMLGI